MSIYIYYIYIYIILYIYIMYLKIDRPSQHHTENLQPRDLARRQRDRQIGLYHVKNHVKINKYMICFIITHHILSHTHDFVKTQGLEPKPRFCIDHVTKPKVFPYTYDFSRLWKYKVYIIFYYILYPYRTYVHACLKIAASSYEYGAAWASI